MADAHKNFATSLVATAPSPAASGLSLVVTAADGAKFPNAPFNATIWPAGVQPTTANAEIVRVTAISTDTFTIVRQQEGTSARTVIVGDQISANITAKTLTDAENPITGVTGGTLAASTDYIAVDTLEISATDSLEIPATSTVEIKPQLGPNIVTYLDLLTTIFGGQVQTLANAGTGGGTMSYINLGGIKLLWIIDAGVHTTGAAGLSYTFTLPANFFNSITAALSNSINQGVLGEQYSNISAQSVSSISVRLVSPAGAANSGISLLVIGT